MKRSIGIPCFLIHLLAASTLFAAEAEPKAPTGLFEIVFSGGIFGIFIILLLVALSMTAAYLAFEHLMTIRRRDVVPEGLAEKVRDTLRKGNVSEARQMCQQKGGVLAVVLANGIDEIDAGWSAVEKSLEDSLSEQSAKLFRRIEYLSVIGNIAPMVGLLGTVTGMIFAFQQVASTQGSAGAGDLAEGIYQALVTTVGGLLVAIPSLGCFAVFRNRVDELMAEVTSAAQQTFAPLRRRKGSSGSSQRSSFPAPPPVK